MGLTSIDIGLCGQRRLAALACGLALSWIALAGSARADGGATGAAPTDMPPDSASLVQCLAAGEAAERAAVFAGEMTMITGAARMSMRVELLERMPGESGYRPVQAPGVGVWHYADADVKTYKHIEQFANLSAPAYYRALITFRWQGPHGRVLKRDERRTPRCEQSPPPSPSPATPLE